MSYGCRVLCQPPKSWQSTLANAQGCLFHYRPPGGAYFASQANTSLCQWALLAGLRTQWPSSGKLIILDGIPKRCRVVKSCKPSATGTRKSRSLWMMSMGVLKFLANRCGENFSYDSRLIQGGPPCSHSSNQSSSVRAYML